MYVIVDKYVIIDTYRTINLLVNQIINTYQDFKLTYMKNISKLEYEDIKKCLLCLFQEDLYQTITFRYLLGC